MISATKKVIPNRIRQARISRSMSILELANRLEVSKQAVSQYELGKIEPSKAILNLISNVLKYPVSYFYKTMPPEETADSAVFFRSGKTTKVKSYRAAKEKIKVFNEISAYLEKFIDFPVINFPKMEWLDAEESLDFEKIEETALILREHWGLGVNPINNLIGTIEKNGITVSRMDLELSKIEGFSIWHNSRPLIFLCEDKDSNVRIRFSAAHELGHLILHADTFTDDDTRIKNLHERLEVEANVFAGAFLLPKETFSKDIYSSSIDHFIRLKSKWKVSISAMIYRCETLGLLSSNQIKYLKNQMTIRGYWRQEPLDSTLQIEKPVAYKQAVNILLENNIITSHDFIEETGIYSNELEKYCFLEKGTLSSVSDSNIIKLKMI